MSNEIIAEHADVASEVWRVIEGTGGRYGVSSLGRIRSEAVRGPMITRRGPKRGGILNPGQSKGYLRFQVREPDGSRRLLKVHRVVAGAFLGPPNGMEVNHKNGIKTDNRVENLEYVTRKGNAIHASGSGLMKPARGSGHYKSKLTENDVKRIRELYQTISLGVIAARFGVTKTTVVRIAKRRGWKHVT